MNWDPDLIVIFGGIVAVVFVVGVSRTFSMWMKARTADPPDLRVMRQRIDEIGNAVDAIAVEVERISESQRFAEQLIAGRAASSATGTLAGRQMPDLRLPADPSK